MSKIHPSVTEGRVVDEAEENTWGMGSTGICLSCGEDRDGCEPDARNYECYECGQNTVFGAEEILLSGYYHRD